MTLQEMLRNRADYFTVLANDQFVCARRQKTIADQHACRIRAATWQDAAALLRQKAEELDELST